MPRFNKQPIYDRKQVAASASQTLNFFKGFIGDTKLTTNMNNSGRIGNDQVFFADAISLHTEAGTPLGDVVKLLEYSFIDLKIASLPILECPLFCIPDNSGIMGAVATTQSSERLQSWANGKAPYLPLSLSDEKGRPMPIPIGSDDSIECQVIMAAGSAPSAAFYLWVFLHGVLTRK